MRKFRDENADNMASLRSMLENTKLTISTLENRAKLIEFYINNSEFPCNDILQQLNNDAAYHAVTLHEHQVRTATDISCSDAQAQANFSSQAQQPSSIKENSRNRNAECTEELNSKLIEIGFRANPVPCAVIDDQLHFCCVNESMARLHNIPAADHAGRAISEIACNGVFQNISPVIRRVLEKRNQQDSVITFDHSGHAWRMQMFTVQVDGNNFAACFLEDATELVKSNQRMHEHQLMLATISDNLPRGGIYSLSYDGETFRFDYLSKGVERQFGVCASDAYFDISIITDRFQPDDAQLLKTACLRCLENGTPVDIMVRYTHVSGRIHWLQIRMARSRRRNGTWALDGVALDETRLMTHRNELKDREATLRALGDNLPDGAIYRLIRYENGQHTLLYASSAAPRVLGVPLQRLYNDFNQAMRQAILPEDLDLVSRAEAHALATNTPLDVQFRLKTVDGTLRWVHCRAASTPHSDSGIHWNGVILDVTAFKSAEADLEALRLELHDIIEAMPSAVYGVDRGGTITFSNPAAKALLTSDAEGNGEPATLDDIPELAPYRDMIVTAIREQRPIRLERRQAVIDGMTLCYDIIVYPLQGRSQNEVIIRLDDVTERSRLEEMIVQSEKMLSVGGLAAGMAHEINNPLAGILQGAQNIRRRLSSELPGNLEATRSLGMNFSTLQQYLTQRGIFILLDGIKDSGERAAHIVRNMLEFSRRGSREKSSVQIRPLLERAVALVSTDFDLELNRDFKHITTCFDIEDELPEIVCAGIEIEQVIVNLLRNAQHAMYTARISNPMITLRARKKAASVRIEVCDNGPGMDEATRRKVFEPFFTTKAPGEGTGLGLSLCYFIVTQFHNGTFAVESAPENGTRFIIDLPV